MTEAAAAKQLTGVVIALSAEARSLVGRSIPVDQIYHQGSLRIYVCGMGADNARRATERLLQAGCKRLLSWGTAGALSETHRPGDLLLPEQVLTSARESYATDPVWRDETLKRLRCTSYPGILLSSDEVLRTRDQKQLAQRRYQAIAVDMESAAVAKLASSKKIPLLVIRAVVDSAEMSVPGFTLKTIDRYGRSKLFETLCAVASHPGSVGALLKLGSAFKQALLTLSQVAPLIHDEQDPHASV